MYIPVWFLTVRSQNACFLLVIVLYNPYINTACICLRLVAVRNHKTSITAPSCFPDGADPGVVLEGEEQGRVLDRSLPDLQERGGQCGGVRPPQPGVPRSREGEPTIILMYIFMGTFCY